MATIEDFDKFETSVKTFIIYLNIDINIEEMFNKKVFPITEYVIQQKKRGRKKKTVDEDPNKGLEDGSIVQIKYKDQVQGTVIKSGKSKSTTEFFRNATAIYIYIDGKLINFKVSSKGKLQMTGCKNVEQSRKCVSWFWKYVEPHDFLYTFKNGDSHLKAYYDPVMRNIGFCLDFKINRQFLHEYVNTNTVHRSIFENTLGYAGVNIKFENDVETEKINKTFEILVEEFNQNSVIESTIPYMDFTKLMAVRKKKRYVTFLIFQSGIVIMSGKDSVYMENPFREFITIMSDARPHIEDKTAV